MGRVTAEHSQFSWLIGLGVSLHDLAALSVAGRNSTFSA